MFAFQKRQKALLLVSKILIKVLWFFEAPYFLFLDSSSKALDDLQIK